MRAHNVRLLAPGGLRALRFLYAVLLLGLVWTRGYCQNSSPAAENGVPLRILVVTSADEASRILEQLKAGADFAVLAKERSTDPTSDAGGYMGRVDPATLRPELRDAINSLSPGQISQVIHLPSGYAVLKRLDNENVQEMEAANQRKLAALSAVGSLKFAPPVSGFGEAEAALIRYPKPAGWNQNLQAICQLRKQSYANAVSRMEQWFGPGNSDTLATQSPLDLMQEHYALAELYSYNGDMDKSLPQYLAAYEVAQRGVPAAASQMEEQLAIAYLHKSEMENGLFRQPGDKCLVPMPPTQRITKPEDTRKAVEYLLKHLDKSPDDVAARWFLNLAYLLLGEYPGGVPPQFLIAPERFASKEQVGRFVDVAPSVGIDLFSMAGGVIVDDFENNGRLDVVTSSMEMCEHMHYFHNNGDGTFSDRTQQSGLMEQLGGLNIIQADYNNDGCTDILVLRGGWEFPMRKSLLRNNCDGTFTDVTKAVGLGEPATATQTAVWVDINNDGWLDLFVGNENGPAQLFLNKGDGTFTDIAHSAGVDSSTFAKAVVAADYDGDGYPDLYVSNYGGHDNFLYRNNGNNTFTDVAAQAGVTGPSFGFPTWFFDYDNDGWPDLFVTSYFMSTEESVRTLMGEPHNAPTMKLYKNLGNGAFKDVSSEVGLDKVYMPMGANYGDIDNDGYLDIYLGNGNPSYTSELPHVLLRNHDGKFFADVTQASGTGELHKGHGVAFADVERDGHEDILTVTGGAVPGDKHAFRLFANPGNENDWINVKLVGVKTNRSAIGALIKVTVQDQRQGTRAIYRTVGSGGSFGASPLEQHIGLGKIARISAIEITWPTSKTRQEFTNVEKNHFIQIKEFEKNYIALQRRLARFKTTSVAPAVRHQR